MSTAIAILLLPAGFRAVDGDFTVPLPPPRMIDLRPEGLGCFHRVAVHHPGLVDPVTRALYVLGGRFLPYGAIREARALPEEMYDL